jgi:hypothetical protein
MAHHQNETEFSRRAFLEVSSGALAAAGVGSVTNMAGQDQSGERKDERSENDSGPANHLLEAQNPASNNPPPTDAGGLPPFKYPFAFVTGPHSTPFPAERLSSCRNKGARNDRPRVRPNRLLLYLVPKYR